MSLTQDAQTLAPELTALRHELHQIPEIGLQLPQTQAAILRALEGLPLRIVTGTSTTSVVAVLEGGRPGPVVLLRGDMDALPVAENTGLDFAATNGNMHACGHDLHITGLVGAAKLLSGRQAELAGSVIFMFQPGEEGFAGARYMLEEGLLEAAGQKPVAAYGLHVFPGPLGEFQYRPGPIMAGANELTITVRGRGGHGSRPQDAVDPVAPLVAIASELQTMVTRKFDVFDPVVLTITRLRAGEAHNVIPDTASLGATVRTLSAESTRRMEEEATRLATSIAAGFGASAEVDFVVNYPVTVNDAAETAWAAEQLGEEFGADKLVPLVNPMMGSEDFSFVLQEVPGTFMFMGASPAGLDPENLAWNHSPEVLFDDAALPLQAAALARLAIERLARG